METKGRKVLIADDEPDILELLSYNLVKEGYSVITAKDGDEAVHKAKQTLPDLIVLDMMMPKKAAWKYARFCARKPRLKTRSLCS